MARQNRELRFERLHSRELCAAIEIVDGELDASSSFIAPLQLSNAKGVRSAEIRVSYDPEELKTDIGRINSGSLWGGSGAVVANIDDVLGTITAYVFATEATEKEVGNLLEIGFETVGHFNESSAAKIQIENVRLNEGNIVLTGVSNEKVSGVNPDELTVSSDNENAVSFYEVESSTTDAIDSIGNGKVCAPELENHNHSSLPQGEPDDDVFSSFGPQPIYATS